MDKVRIRPEHLSGGMAVRRNLTKNSGQERIMPTLSCWVTVVHGVADTTAKDLHRSEKIFHGVNLAFKPVKHTLNKAQTNAILGNDGKLEIAGGPTEFDHDIPAGAGGSR